MTTNARYQFDRINFRSTIASELERCFPLRQTAHLRTQLYAGLPALSGAVHLGKIRHRGGGRNGRLLTADSWGGGELDAKVEVDRDMSVVLVS
ncbi:hypothetical protein [Microcoleus sp. MOSTC5]|uniref:hypothetical protein n=1 Tax=Microcoleus sp. MOSTC5 TaxID=3055378 RepID=UPI002FD23902